MKSRHAATLTLVAWCLLSPPSGADLKIAATAPLSQWINHHSYDSAADCEARRREIIDSLRDSEPDAAENFKASLCISTDDPRLHEKQ